MTTHHRLAAPSLALLLLAACAPADPGSNSFATESFRGAVPTADDVKLRAPGEPGSGTKAMGQGFHPGVAVAGEPTTKPAYAQAYRLTRAIFDGTNLGTAYVLGSLWLVVHTPPTSVTRNTAIWGPWTDALQPAEWRLRATETAPGAYTYVVEGKKKGAGDGEYRATLEGSSFAPGDARHGMGSFTIDNDVASSLDPARLRGDKDTGTITVTYDISKLARLSVDAKPSGNARWWSVISHREAGGGGRIDVDAVDDLDETKTTKDEHITLKSHWAATGAGRSDFVITSGDLPPGISKVNATECWSTTFLRTFYTDDVGVEATQGTADLCPFSSAE